MSSSPTRIAVVAPPGLLVDIVYNALKDEPDLDVVTLEEASLPVAIAERKVDVLILGSADERASIDYRELLYAHPRLRVLAVLADGRQTALYELYPRETKLGALSPGGLVRAIRDAARTVRLRVEHG
jgi:hypothetical protein